MKITIFGTGYVGLVTGACLAEVGNHVICVDVDEAKIAHLQKGKIPIFEPGLDEYVLSNQFSGRLIFTTDVKTAVVHGDIIFVAVGTPPTEEGDANLQHVLDVAGSIGKYMDNYKLVVSKSTVPVGTGNKVRSEIEASLAFREETICFDVASNPEFLKEGAAIEDFMKPDRIIVGTDSAEAEQALKRLYAPFTRNHDRFIAMSIRSAELTKYAANAMLATKISFMNEMSNLADKLGADIEEVRKGIGSDPRIGYQFIYPGVGYGGSCFPKDLKALLHTGKEIGYKPQVIASVEMVNEEQKKIIYKKIKAHYQGELAGKTVALWGLAFKPKTDDMRESPSRVLMEALWQAGVTIRAHDPEAMREAERIYGKSEHFVLCATPEETLLGADCLIIMTEWNIFRSPSFDLIKRHLSSPVIFDGRNMYEPALLKKKGFIYYSIGRAITTS